MKNLFLIKKITSLFSYGKDSVYHYYKCFYKKRIFFFVNYKNNFFKCFFFKIKYFIIINTFSINENILRKIKYSLLKINNFFLTNHHYLDKIENFFFSFFKKKKKISNNWFYKKNFLIKPYLNIILKNYKLNLLDKYNKNINFNRNFLRCLINKFIK